MLSGQQVNIYDYLYCSTFNFRKVDCYLDETNVFFQLVLQDFSLSCFWRSLFSYLSSRLTESPEQANNSCALFDIVYCLYARTVLSLGT